MEAWGGWGDLTMTPDEDIKLEATLWWAGRGVSEVLKNEREGDGEASHHMYSGVSSG